jgi:hypothetical protein
MPSVIHLGQVSDEFINASPGFSRLQFQDADSLVRISFRAWHQPPLVILRP